MTDILDIENSSLEELQQNAESLIEAARNFDGTELASRYLKAVEDAKRRDARLAEMGEQIRILQAAADALGEKNVAVSELKEKLAAELDEAKSRHALELAKVEEELRQARDRYEHLLDDLRNKVRTLETELMSADRKIKQIKEAAVRNSQAITGAAKMLNDCIGSQEVEAIITGA